MSFFLHTIINTFEKRMSNSFFSSDPLQWVHLQHPSHQVNSFIINHVTFQQLFQFLFQPDPFELRITVSIIRKFLKLRPFHLIRTPKYLHDFKQLVDLRMSFKYRLFQQHFTKQYSY